MPTYQVEEFHNGQPPSLRRLRKGRSPPAMRHPVRRCPKVSGHAAVSGLSTYHFIRAFSKTFAVPPHQYVLDQRLDFAENLLLDGRMSIAEVAHLAGFSSQSHFTTVMKKYRGVTPSQARPGGVVLDLHDSPGRAP